MMSRRRRPRRRQGQRGRSRRSQGQRRRSRRSQGQRRRSWCHQGQRGRPRRHQGQRRRPQRRQGPRRRARRPQGPRRSAGSSSRRAQLQFSVSHMERLLRESPYAKRLSPSTPVFLAGILEYLTVKVLDLASKVALSDRKTRITPEHVQRALGSHQHLSRLLEGHSFSRSIRFPLLKSAKA